MADSDPKTAALPPVGNPQPAAPAPAGVTASAPAEKPATPPAAPAPPPRPPAPKMPPPVPFVAQGRADVDQKEPVADGARPVGSDREWVGYAQQAKTGVPDTFGWFHSPKQRQDEEM